MTLSSWNPPKFRKPSSTYLGEESPEVLYSAVGKALSRWEHAESALVKLFQVMCETPTLNACRAYGTITSATGRSAAIRAAAAVFFEKRDRTDFEPIDKLVKAYSTAAGFRNNIGHGIATGCHNRDTSTRDHLGYYLMCPSYGAKRSETPDPRTSWWLGSKYFYRKYEIDACTSRFEEILRELMSITMTVNEKYQILEPGQFHP